MGTYQARVVEIRLDRNGYTSAFIACSPGAIPAPGQYGLGSCLEESAPLAASLFLEEAAPGGFWAAPPLPVGWRPGMSIHLRSPLGRGFSPPAGARRLALAALGATPARLLPLAFQALDMDAAVALFTNTPLPSLPASIEAYPLSALAEALPWANYLAVDLPLDALSQLKQRLAGPMYMTGPERLACPAQALITTPMPCAGLAQCGACAVPARRGWLMACEDGPVFDLSELKWRE